MFWCSVFWASGCSPWGLERRIALVESASSWEVSSKFSGGVSEVDACYNEGLGCRDFGVILGLY